MRLSSHTDRLLQIDHARRRHYYGRPARIRQLCVLLGAALTIYLACVLWHWFYPLPSAPIAIDGVRVEVVDEDWLVKVQEWALRAAMLCAVTLLVYRYLLEADNDEYDEDESRVRMNEKRAARDESNTVPDRTQGEARNEGEQVNELHTKSRATQGNRLSDLLPPNATLTCRRTSKSNTNTAVDKADRPAAAMTSASAWPTAASSRESEQRLKVLPVRSSEELDRFLHCALDRQPSEKTANRTAGPSDILRTTTVNTSGINVVRNMDNLLQSNGVGTTLSRPAFAQDGLCVSYDLSNPAAATMGMAEGGGNSTDGALADIAHWHSRGQDERQWAELLGMTGSLDRALGKARAWCSEVCRKLVCEIDECDKWFAEKSLAGFGCANSLQETITVTVPPASSTTTTMTSGGTAGFNAFAPRSTFAWGGNSSSTALTSQPTTQTITKLQALLQEKELVRTRPTQSTYDFDTVLHYEQRLALEGQLDMSLTFPQEGGAASMTAQERSARQQYIIRRLRTFAKQSSLISYTANGGAGGEEEGGAAFRPGFPCDAHLLVHIIRTRVQGLSKLIGFSYQQRPQTHHNSITLCIGDVGEPFFYVRHQHAAGASVQILHTQAGVQSLFEALALLVALIHTQYHDVYGDLRGTLSLHESGLDALLA